MTDKATTTQVYRIVIKASAQAIWDAITKPEWGSGTLMKGASNTI